MPALSDVCSPATVHVDHPLLALLRAVLREVAGEEAKGYRVTMTRSCSTCGGPVSTHKHVSRCRKCYLAFCSEGADALEAARLIKYEAEADGISRRGTPFRTVRSTCKACGDIYMRREYLIMNYGRLIVRYMQYCVTCHIDRYRPPRPRPCVTVDCGGVVAPTSPSAVTRCAFCYANWQCSKCGRKGVAHNTWNECQACERQRYRQRQRDDRSTLS